MRKVLSMVLAIAMVMSLASVAFAAEFSDVPADAWYAKAVDWAVEEGVTAGYGNVGFAPDVNCNRAQIVTFLYRMAGEPSVEAENPFTDVAADAWYANAVLWAVEQGITSGYGSTTTFKPDQVCDRAQIVTFLYNYAGKPEIEAENPFTDVADGAWYTNAVLWAVDRGITAGYGSTTTFKPGLTCTRAQAVTFLYRYVRTETVTITSMPWTTDVNAGETRSYAGKLTGTTMTIANAQDLVVAVESFNGSVTEYTPSESGVITVNFATGTATVNFTITNNGAEDGEYSLNFTYPLGSLMNPAELALGATTTSISYGDSDGYTYTWTAPEDGVLTLTAASTNEAGWCISVTNQYNSVNETVYSTDGNTVSIDVKAGNIVSVNVSTFDASNPAKAPAGTVQFVTEFASTATSGTVNLWSSEEYKESKVVKYTAAEEGILTLTVSGDPGYQVKITDAEGVPSLPQSGSAEKTYTFELYAGDVYYFEFWCYDPNEWSTANGDVTYALTFEACKHEVKEEEKAKYVVSDTELILGDNTLTLDESAISTLYSYTPTEKGSYTFTGPEGAIVGYWGGGTWYLVDPKNDSNVWTWECTGVGQSAYIGVSGVEGEFTLNVAKTADAEEEVVIERVAYVNKHNPTAFTLPTLAEGEEIIEVDITESHSAVLGEDGFYHLDTVDGPILYIDMETLYYTTEVDDYGDTYQLGHNWSLHACYDFSSGGLTANNLNGDVVDADGKVTAKYDFLSAMRDYDSATDSEGYYYLTEDLMTFMQAFGRNQGWYLSNLSPYDEIQAGGFDANTAWMVNCFYIGTPEAEVEPLTLGSNVMAAEMGLAGVTNTWTAEADGTLTVELTALSFLDPNINEWTTYTYGLDAAISWGDIDIFVNGTEASSAATTVNVSAGEVVEVVVRSNYFAFEATMNLSFEEGTGSADGNTLVLGNNEIQAEDVVLTYTAESDGTLYLGLGAAIGGDVSAKVYVSGNEAAAETLSTNSSIAVDLLEGETAVIEVTAAGYATLNAVWEGSSSGSEVVAAALKIGTNAINAADAAYTYTAAEAGTLKLSMGGAVGGDVSVVYSVNGGADQALALSSSVELALAANDTVLIKVTAAGYSSLTAEWTAESTGDGDGETELPTVTPGDGTSYESPLVIDAMPCTINGVGTYDLYYAWVVTADGVVTISYTGGYCSFGDGTDWDGDNEAMQYTVNVTAGQILYLNPWGYSDNTYTLSFVAAE